MEAQKRSTDLVSPSLSAEGEGGPFCVGDTPYELGQSAAM